jgi:hypothetical protein
MKNIIRNRWAGLMVILALFTSVALPQNIAAHQEIQDDPFVSIEPAVLEQVRLQG